ncbi:MAG: glucokinase, partial [Rhodocyclaceae bacterium]|nr:glucokinase [Rhodocyclaceae bacterium]
MKLCADIGGTNARFALADPGTTTLFHERYLTCADYPDFESVLADYLASFNDKITGGCLAVAGPVADDGKSARITNLPWTVEVEALSARFGLPPLMLVNDFAAAALGVTVADSLITLQEGIPLPHAPRLVVGAGTGLGMAILIPDGIGWRVLPGEGGHAGFSPQNETQMRIHATLLAEQGAGGRVTCGQLISGPGFTTIHRILTGETLAPADITAPCSIDVFLSAYGAFAGDMALTILARGGVFLAGGIIEKFIGKRDLTPFLEAFHAKAPHVNIMRQLPIYAVIDPALGLKGACQFSSTRMVTK